MLYPNHLFSVSFVEEEVPGHPLTSLTFLFYFFLCRAAAAMCARGREVTQNGKSRKGWSRGAFADLCDAHQKCYGENIKFLAGDFEFLSSGKLLLLLVANGSETSGGHATVKFVPRARWMTSTVTVVRRALLQRLPLYLVPIVI